MLFRVCLAFAFAYGFAGCLAADESVVARHLKAIGGANALESLKTVIREAECSGANPQGNFSGIVREWTDLQNERLKSQLTISGVYELTTFIANGQGLLNEMQSQRVLSEQERNYQLLGSSPSALAMLAIKHGAKPFVVRASEFDGKDCWHVTTEHSPAKFFLDQETHFLIGFEVYQYAKATYSNHQKIEGVVFPTKAVIAYDAQSTTLDYSYTSTRINEVIDEATFIAPKTSNSPPDSNPGPDSNQRQAKQYLASLDKDGDGKISFEEAPESVKGSFRQIDANKDNFVDTSELAVALSYSQPTTMQTSRSEDLNNQQSLEELFADLDKNEDSKISIAEASDDLRLYFTTFDKNHDSFVDLQEAQALVPYLEGKVDTMTGSSNRVGELIVKLFDSDGDRKVSKEEAPAEFKDNLHYFDSNGDGALSTGEASQLSAHITEEQILVLAGRATRASDSRDAASGQITGAQIVASMDKNQNGTIEKTEANAQLKPYFDTQDTNGDGVIDKAEAQLIADYVNGQQASQQKNPVNEKKPGGYSAKQIVAFMDKDGDQKISRAEAPAELKPNFKYLDSNGDGYIDIQEAGPMAEYANSGK